MWWAEKMIPLASTIDAVVDMPRAARKFSKKLTTGANFFTSSRLSAWRSYTLWQIRLNASILVSIACEIAISARPTSNDSDFPRNISHLSASSRSFLHRAAFRLRLMRISLAWAEVQLYILKALKSHSKHNYFEYIFFFVSFSRLELNMKASFWRYWRSRTVWQTNYICLCCHANDWENAGSAHTNIHTRHRYGDDDHSRRWMIRLRINMLLLVSVCMYVWGYAVFLVDFQIC